MKQSEATVNQKITTEEGSPVSDWVADQVGIPKDFVGPEAGVIEIFIFLALIVNRFVFPAIEKFFTMIRKVMVHEKRLVKINEFYTELKKLRSILKAERVSLMMIDEAPKVAQVSYLYRVHTVGSEKTLDLAEVVTAEGIPVDELFSRIITHLDNNTSLVYETRRLPEGLVKVAYRKAKISHTIWSVVQKRRGRLYFLSCNYKQRGRFCKITEEEYEQHINLIQQAAKKVAALF